MMKLTAINNWQVRDILEDPELFGRIAEDGVQWRTYLPPSSDSYLGVYVNEELIGFWWLIQENSTTLDVHCNILKEHRYHGVEAARRFLKLVRDTFPTQIQKLICKIPVNYPEVYHFTKKFGFQDEGLDRQSIRKNGELVDRYMLGLLREEID